MPSPADRLCSRIDAAPSPYHAVAVATDALEEAGWVPFSPGSELGDGPGAYVARGGSLVAWRNGVGVPRSFRVIGAHTDSPNLRLNPRPDHTSAGWAQVNVEVYGGVLLNSWLDRDLGLSGRVVVDDDGGPRTALFRIDEPLLRIPQLAIHLDREVNDKGFKLNPQEHLRPVWAVASGDDTPRILDRIADAAGVDAEAVVSWDAMLHDVAPAARVGDDGMFVSAPRLDNLCSSFAALDALLAIGDEPADQRGGVWPVVCLYDHEEIGSTSTTGADSVLLAHVLEQVCADAGGGRDDLLTALPASVCASADMAHATHPNYVDRHDPDHHIAVNGGPVIKINANQRYASNAETIGVFELACRRAEVPVQRFVSRNDIPCGSTIGPVTSARLGIPTVDVGIAQLAMHSARELCGAADVEHYTAAMHAFLAP